MDSPNFSDTVTSLSTITNSLMSHSIPVPQMEDIMNMSVSSKIQVIEAIYFESINTFDEG